MRTSAKVKYRRDGRDRGCQIGTISPIQRRMENGNSASEGTASELDKSDEFSRFRSRFSLPSPVYLCGHSLGPQPHAVRTSVLAHLSKWASEGVDGHFKEPEPWAKLEDTASALGCPIVGALPGEVVFMNSLTINLHLLLTAFYTPDIITGRVEVILEDHAFPSDQYAVHSHLKCRGIDPGNAIVHLAPRPDEYILREDDIIHEITLRARRGSLALVILPGVQYYTGQVFPMRRIASTCRELNIPFGLDLAHAVGNIPLCLHDWDVDFAVWCTYKYLNSGPGATGGAFVHARHGDCRGMNRLGGWWGHNRKNRFAMQSEFQPQAGVYGFQVSNPSALALAPVAASLQIFAEAGGVKSLREKSIRLTNFLEHRLRDVARNDVEIITPAATEQRGCQLSIRLKRASGGVKWLQAKLKDRGIICDVREPDVLRVTPVPLYNSFSDIEVFVQALGDLLLKVPASTSDEICAEQCLDEACVDHERCPCP